MADVGVMIATLAPRRMLLWLLIAVTALLFAGAGQALAARCAVVSQSTTAVNHGPVAYADGKFTVARHGVRRPRLTHATVRSMVLAAHGHPIAYADGVPTHARRHHRRRSLTHTA
jgi:hypothetical protein